VSPAAVSVVVTPHTCSAVRRAVFVTLSVTTWLIAAYRTATQPAGKRYAEQTAGTNPNATAKTDKENDLQLRIKKLAPEAQLPTRAHDTDAGFDLYANTTVTVASGKNVLVPTGIAVSLPQGTVGLIHPRSGLAAKHMITVLNAPGTVDEGYTGEVLVNLVNHGRKPYVVHEGDRIAQLLIQAVEHPIVHVVDQLQPTERGIQGHGSTGV